MKKVGFLAGEEHPFISDMIDNLQNASSGEVTAELCAVPDLRLVMEPPYDLIIDRISHVMPYYLQYTKLAMLKGTYVINNPFRFYVEKFFGYLAARELGVPVPKTVLLPPKNPPEGFEDGDLANLVYPLDWEDIIDHVGFPAFFKPAGGWGWRDVYRVHDFDELMHYYDQSGSELMLLQQEVEYDHYVRCICLGKKYTMPIKYLTDRPYHEQYVVDHQHLTAEQGRKVHDYSCVLSDFLDFDMNVCEFAIKGNEITAIDFTNMVPDFNPGSIRWHYYDWVIETMTRVVLEYLEKPPAPGVWPSAWKVFNRYR